jgi:hypothetical protein
MERARLHALRDIVILSILAVICGADGFVQIEDFGKAKEDWLGKVLDLPNGIPSHDTIGRDRSRHHRAGRALHARAQGEPPHPPP